VSLHELVATEAIVFRVDGGKVLWSCDFLGVEHRVVGDVIVLQQVCFESVGKFVEGSSGISESSLAAFTLRWQLVRKQK